MRNCILALSFFVAVSVSAQGHGPFSGDSPIPGIQVDGDPELAVSTYPNPVINNLFVEIDLAVFEPERWQLYDLLGNIVLEGQVEDPQEGLKINLSEQDSEIYLLRIYGVNGHLVTKRIVKK